VNEVYQQPDLMLEIILGISKISGMHEVEIYKRLKACSMDLESFQKSITNFDKENHLIWTKEEDDFLLEQYKNHKPFTTLYRYKG
jgi:hypothetical protein